MMRSPQSSFHSFPEFRRSSVSFSKDGQWVAYVSFPEGTLWTSKLDGSQRLQLSYPPLYAMLPRWSPDGKQIVFYAFSPGQKTKLYTVSTDGGTPREMIPEDLQDTMGPQLVARRNKNCLRRRFL